LTTDEAVYAAEYEDVEEWPVGWPAAEPLAAADRGLDSE
jgi:hypothetical protein